MATSKERSSTGRITPSEPARSKAHTEFLREYLSDDANVAALLDEALAGGDEGDIMYARPQVRDLSTRDISTALLLYDLAPGTLRVGN